MSRKEARSDDGPGQEPIPLNSKLWCFFLFPLIIFMMSFNIDVSVLWDVFTHERTLPSAFLELMTAGKHILRHLR